MTTMLADGQIVNVFLLDLAPSVHEAVTPNADSTYTIVLNARDSDQRRQESYQHAIGHIIRGDFEKSNVQQIETEAHALRSIG
jgi:hypothetical protein